MSSQKIIDSDFEIISATESFQGRNKDTLKDSPTQIKTKNDSEDKKQLDDLRKGSSVHHKEGTWILVDDNATIAAELKLENEALKNQIEFKEQLICELQKVIKEEKEVSLQMNFELSSENKILKQKVEIIKDEIETARKTNKELELKLQSQIQLNHEQTKTFKLDSNTLNQLNTQIGVLKFENSKLKEQLDHEKSLIQKEAQTNSSKFVCYEEQIKKLSQKLGEKENELKTRPTQMQLDENKTLIKKLQDEIISLREANSDNKNYQIATIASLEDEITKLKTSLSKKEIEFKIASNLIEELKANQKLQETVNSQLRVEISEQKDQLSKFLHQLNNNKMKSQEPLEQERYLSEENNKLKQELLHTKQALDIQTERLKTFKSEYEELMGQTDSLEKSRVQRVVQASDKEEQIKKLSTEMDCLMKQYSDRLEEIDGLRAEIMGLKSENTSLVEFIKAEVNGQKKINADPSTIQKFGKLFKEMIQLQQSSHVLLHILSQV